MTDTINEPVEAEKPGFNLQDLIFVLQIIEACTQRGSFRAEELTTVGSVYDRLKGFLASNGAFDNAETETANPTPGDDV
jgi:hypothetical protein